MITSQIIASSDVEAVSPENSPLTLSNIDPYPGVSYFQADQPVRLIFNKTVFAGQGDIVLSNGADTRTIPVTDTSQISFDGAVVTIQPATDLMADTTYSIQMGSGAIVDVEGRAFNGLDRGALLVSSAADPQLNREATPDLTEFEVDKAIKLYFDERVKAGQGNIILRSETDTRTIAIDDTSQVEFNVFGGGKVTINPTEDLLGDTVYTLEIGAGVMTDGQNNPFAGANDITIATITTDPEIVHSNPINHSSLKADSNIELLFNRTVKAGLGNIVLSNGEDTRTIAIDDTSQVTFDGSAVIIDPTEDLQVGATYTVNLAAGVIADTAGHDYPGFKDATANVLSPEPALLFSSLEYPGERYADDNIEFYFDEKIAAGGGNIIISNGNDTRIIAANDADQVLFLENRLIINPAEDLFADTVYTVKIEGDAVADLNGNHYSGIDNLTLEAADSSPFIISSNTRSSLKVDQSLQLFFNEAIVVGQGNIVISNGTDTRTIDVADKSQVSLNQESTGLYGRPGITIHLATDLMADSTYTVKIDSGVVTDQAGHAFKGLSDAQFSTISSAPLLTSSFPAIGAAIDNDEDLYFFFDEAVQAGSGNIVISNGSDTHTIDIHDTTQVTFSTNMPAIYEMDGIYTIDHIIGPFPSRSFGMIINPTNDLLAETTYTVQIDAGVITDTVGNHYAGLDQFEFSTEISAPQLVESNPVDGTTIKTDGEIKLSFNELVAAGTGNIVLRSDSDTRVISIDDDSQVTFNGNSVTINPTEELLSNTPYRVDMASGVIVDKLGNAFAGFEDAVVMATNSNPLLTHSSPKTGADIKVNNNIQLWFDEKVMIGNGNIVISNGTDTRTIAIDDASQVHLNNGKTALIDPAEDLIADTTYTVTIDDGAFTDEAGHPLVDGHMTFTVTDGPVLQRIGPETNIISTNSMIGLNFDENIVLGSGDIVLTGDGDIRTIAIDDAKQVTLDNNLLMIGLEQHLIPDMPYQIEIVRGAIEDVDGNPYNGISEADGIHVISREIDIVPDPFVTLL